MHHVFPSNTRKEVGVWQRDTNLLALGVLGVLVVLLVGTPFITFQTQWQRTIVVDILCLLLYFVPMLLAWKTARHPLLNSRLRRVWWLLGAALLSFNIGNLLWLNYDFHNEAPFPSWADAAFLSAYPLLLASLLSIPLPRQPLTERRTFWLDIGIVMLGSTMLLWAVVIQPTVAVMSPNPLEAALALAYPVASLVLLFGITAVALRRPLYTSNHVVALLLSGLAMIFVADLLFGALNLLDLYQNGGWSDTFYGLAMFLLGLSAVMQQRQAVSRQGASVQRRDTALFRWLPYVAVAIGFAVLLWAMYDQWNGLAGQLVFGAVALTGLVVVRQALAVRENGRLLAERAALEGEARLRTLIEHASDSILVVAPDGAIHYQTPSAGQIAGLGKDAEKARSLLHIVHPDDRAQTEVYLHQLAEQPGIGPPVEWRVQYHGGSWHTVEVVGNNLLQNPLVSGLVLTLRDISDRQARQVAEAANQAKSVFLSTMSHELRTPLTSIIGYSELLAHSLRDAQQHELLADAETIQRAGHHLLAIINDVLDLSKIEAGKMDVSLQPCSLPDLFRQVSATAEPLIAKQRNQLVVECPSNIPALYTDPTKLRQVLLNLLSNAAKFTSDGTVTMTARAEPTPDMQRRLQLVIEVKDTGIGIDPKRIKSLFQPFTQATETTTRLYGGTGLGLALCRNLCQLLGGTIELSSELGHGTTVTVRLALDQAERGDDPVAPIPMPSLSETHLPSPAAGHLVQPSLVLVIDDDPMVADMLARALSNETISLVPIATGAEGLQLARDLQPDAIILDVLLPDMDGWSVLTALKSDAALRDIPVIMLTILDAHTQGFTLGATAYLTKPFNPQEVAATLKRYSQPQRVAPELPKTALLIEDDSATRALLGRVFTDDGWNVVAVETGSEAQVALDYCRPDLVVSDLMLPDTDGITLINALRTRMGATTPPVILLTAADLSAAERAHLTTAVDRILAKHAMGSQELLKEVTEVLRTYTEPYATEEEMH